MCSVAVYICSVMVGVCVLTASFRMVVVCICSVVSKPQAQAVNKVPTKQVCDPQSNYPVTQSQTRKSTQTTKSTNMNR
ncbi:hypothetical protein DSO57_1002817 [Entomophthora muscae]|uniref:Uncharacterized protein n=1 Tax=Entomophthora muscae TaxID=34485 RepID=A0ACC2SAV1_9FUNG|nr:hypothetical protein DSO57_1002817 [Entomophthora muscae]